MRRRTLAFLPALILSVAAAVPCGAQTNSDQSSQQSGPATSTASAGTKKVWTNDDVGGLRDGPAISTFTEPKAVPAKISAKPASKGRDAKWYQTQITKLQALIPPLDSQIAQLQAAIEGTPTGNAKESTRPYGVKQDQWPAELHRLQKKHADIEAHISAIEDEARHNGVPPNALP